jgi:hypothetical protein
MGRRQLVLLLAALAAPVITGSSARSATVAIAPADTAIALGEEITLRVTVDTVTDLKGCDLVWSYTPSHLQFLSAQAADVLGGGGSYFDYLLPDITAPADSVWYDAAVLTGTGAGPGNIVFLKFKAIATGVGLVNCLSADLRDSQNVSTHPACLGGMVRILPATRALPVSWGRVKGIYR